MLFYMHTKKHANYIAKQQHPHIESPFFAFVQAIKSLAQQGLPYILLNLSSSNSK